MNYFVSGFRCIINILLLCTVVSVSASEQLNSFVTIDHENGLSNSSVSGIVQDSSGFLWFGTQNGLNRYDGTSFKIFENDPFDRNSLSQNLIQTMFIDSDDVLWIGTYGGLNRFDTKTEMFTVYQSNHEAPDSLSNDLVISIFRDSRGNLWIGTMKGLNILDEKTGKFKRFLHRSADSSSLAADTIRSICEDYRGNLWIGTADGGLDRYDYATETFIHHRHDPRDPYSLPSNSVMAIDEDPSGNLWIATWDYGLSRYDIVAGKFENYRIPEARSYCLNARESGVVRIGSWGGGLWEYRPYQKTMSVIKHNSKEFSSLSHDVVYSLFIDHVGDLWVGTNGGGVNRLNRSRQNYTVFRNDPEDPDSIAPGKVTTVMEDRTGTFWIGVYSGGVNRLDRKTGRIKHYRYNAHNPSSLSNDIVNYIYEDSEDIIWILTNEGLNRYVPSSDTFIRYYSVPGKDDSLSSNILYYMLEEPSSGNLWIATYTQGLDYFVRKDKTFRHYLPSDSDQTSLSDPLVTCLIYDTQKRLWVGTNNGLNRMDKNGSFRRYYHNVNDHSSIPSNAVRSFFLDSKGSLWVVLSNGGISCYNTDTDSFVTYGKRQGLSSNAAIAILEDADRNLWVSTQKGLDMFDRNSGQFLSLAVQNELRYREFSLGHFRSRAGELYFGGTDGLYCFDPGRIKSNTIVPPIRITAFRVFNEERKLDHAIYLEDSVHVSYRENYIGFSFAALNYRYPEKNQYAYKMDGFDRNWVMCGEQKSASYMNLPGGKYTFRVRGSNNDGLWNTEGASLTVFVATPLWRRPWAIILYIFVGIILMYFVASFKVRDDLARKVEELTILKQKLELLSLSDSLTGIPNRRKLNEEFETLYAYAVRQRVSIAVLMLDIDYFKAYNDAYGHQSGDECLCAIARTILSSLERTSDFAARYGGEEFVVLLPDSDAEGAYNVAERIRRNVEALQISHRESSVSLFVTVSIGFSAVIPAQQDDRMEPIKLADEALYRAKAAGRNRVSS